MSQFVMGVIQEVRRNDMLFNLRHPSYKDAKAKSKTWDDIARNLNSTTDQCKKKWKTLRDMYHKNNSQQGNRRWKYMKFLQFLDNYDCYRPIKYDEAAIHLNNLNSKRNFNETSQDLSCSSAPQETNRINDDDQDIILVDEFKMENVYISDTSDCEDIEETRFEKEEFSGQDVAVMPALCETIDETKVEKEKFNRQVVGVVSAFRKDTEETKIEKDKINGQDVGVVSAFFKSISLQAENAKFSDERWASLQISIINAMQQELKRQKEDLERQNILK